MMGETWIGRFFCRKFLYFFFLWYVFFLNDFHLKYFLGFIKGFRDKMGIDSTYHQG